MEVMSLTQNERDEEGELHGLGIDQMGSLPTKSMNIR